MIIINVLYFHFARNNVNFYRTNELPWFPAVLWA